MKKLAKNKCTHSRATQRVVKKLSTGEAGALMYCPECSRFRVTEFGRYLVGRREGLSLDGRWITGRRLGLSLKRAVD